MTEHNINFPEFTADKHLFGAITFKVHISFIIYSRGLHATQGHSSQRLENQPCALHRTLTPFKPFLLPLSSMSWHMEFTGRLGCAVYTLGDT